MQPMCLCIFSGRQFDDTHAIQKSRKIPVFYFQKSRYRYLSPISVYRYFPVYRRGLVVSFLSLSFCLFIFVFLSLSVHLREIAPPFLEILYAGRLHEECIPALPLLHLP